ncbi:hypothetical protein [Streptomyces triculaminicus]|uniref:hypothetical protein n=1 Tax=Streptomyces triculaminicus TaxID=2816232 RepID=UPI0037D68DCA
MTSTPQSQARRCACASAKGAFVKALDQALLDGEVDVTVSCVKDLPARTTGSRA